MKTMQLKCIGAVILCLGIAGCAAAPAKVAIRDPERSKEIRKIAVLPFFDTERLSAEFITEGDDKSYYTTMFATEAKKFLSNRYEFVTGGPVEEALKKLGNYKGWVKEEGRHQRTGFTISDALKAGDALGVDAVIIGSGAKVGGFSRAMTVRLIDVKKRYVVWGATAIGSSPATQIAKKLAKEVQ